MKPLFAGIEAGGTKFICAVGSSPQDIRDLTSFPTTQPDETLERVYKFFRTFGSDLSAIGIASFGPLDLRASSPTYGYITSTPKPGWANFNFVGAIRQVYNLPVGFDTDVNGAVLGEWRWGAAQGLDTFVYLTIGTGIGGGALVNAQLLHGLLHPEMGHMLLPHDWQSDPFPGVCPYHGDCFEGLANGPAIEKRWGQPPETLPRDHPAWELEAHYLALGLDAIISILSPQRIIMGGGVMMQPQIFPRLHTKVQEMLNNYVQVADILERIDEYIVPPVLGSGAGVLGALALAERALRK